MSGTQFNCLVNDRCNKQESDHCNFFNAERDTTLDEQLLEACKNSNLEIVQSLIAQGADVSFQEPSEGLSPLMAAAESASTQIVQLLLDNGAVWHAQDTGGHTAGEYAAGRPEILQQLLNFAVRAEMILGVISNRDHHASAQPSNAEYLKSSIQYTDDNQLLVDAEGEGVMMEWERELMKLHAEVICPTPGTGDVLNVGFGLGIIDTFLQEERQPRSHTIIEAHPDVYKRMIQLGWDKKPGVKILFGRWQDIIAGARDDDTATIGPFDGIFFDTYGEYYEDMKDFHDTLPRLLRPGGIYSFFNGLAPDNLFFHLVYGEIARIELGALGLDVSYKAVPVDAGVKDEAWEGVKNRYWYLPVYFVPTCILKSE